MSTQATSTRAAVAQFARAGRDMRPHAAKAAELLRALGAKYRVNPESGDTFNGYALSRGAVTFRTIDNGLLAGQSSVTFTGAVDARGEIFANGPVSFASDVHLGYSTYIPGTPASLGDYARVASAQGTYFGVTP